MLCWKGSLILLALLKEKEVLVLRVCHACPFSRKTIDIEKCAYEFVTTVVS